RNVMMKKIRLDVLLVERNLIDTREKAKRTIMAGLVYSNQERMDKPGIKVDPEIALYIKQNLHPYVRTEILKLEKALRVFSIDVKNVILIDVGSSTGGFTDCALQNGAKMSYAIDVGYNQLDWKLRSDDRVIVMERTNFRYVTSDMLKKGTPNLATVDVSFISLTLILPVLKTLLDKNSEVVILIKPQFEAGRHQVGKGGIIRDPKIHLEVIENILKFAKEEKYNIVDLTYSPITGGEGNIEYLAHLTWEKDDQKNPIIDIQEVIDEAHESLQKKSS